MLAKLDRHKLEKWHKGNKQNSQLQSLSLALSQSFTFFKEWQNE